MYIAQNMAELKDKAIAIKDGTEFYNPIPPTKKQILAPTAFSDAYRKSFAYENGIITFVDEVLNWYVIPEVKGVRAFLKASGYIHAGIYVPGSDGSYPVKDKDKWDALLQQRNDGF